ncbi:MAG: site-2 protease family protein [Chloroflexota bacterium]|nr:MAG: site-2 protease family protein [Chloroflexota bacterium]
MNLDGALRIGRIRGIQISVHWTWLIVFGLITWSLAVGFFPETFPGWTATEYWIVSAVAALLLFGSVLLHELAHSFVALSRGLPVQSIVLFIFGGVSNIQKEPERPQDEFWVTLMGPLSSVVLGVLFLVLFFFLQGVAPAISALLIYLSSINLLLAVFNLIPGFPLDGGRIFRSVVWWITNNFRQSTHIAAIIGQIVAYLFIFGGLALIFTGQFLSGIWLIFIGWFLNSAADASYKQVVTREELRGVKVAEMMTPSPVTVGPSATLRDLVDDYLLQRNVQSVPVVDDDALVGMVTLNEVREVPKEEWDTTTVEQVMTRRDQIKTISPADDLVQAMGELAGDEEVGLLPVVDSGRLVGLLSKANLLRYLKLREQLGAPNARA